MATLQSAVRTGHTKGLQVPTKTLLLSFLAGSFIGLGALLSSFVTCGTLGLNASDPALSGLLKGLFGLPTGLALVVLTGGELFTGNVFFLTAGVLDGSATLTQLKRNWALSYLGNLAGTAFVASLTWAAGTIGSAAAIKGACSIATAKVASAFLPMFFKGVLGNWLVCLALWLAISAQSLPGKVLGIFLPISMFVTLGFEHSIANMFFFWQGWFAGADISVLDAVIRNLLPVTLGNIFGGAVLVGLAYQVAYGNNK